MKWIGCALVVLAAACSSSGTHRVLPAPLSSSTTVTPAPVRTGITTRLELASDVVAPGGSLAGTLVVGNETGRAFPTPMCSAWEVQLTNRQVPAQAILFAKCGLGPVFAVGEHRYVFTLTAAYPCGPVPPPTGPCGNDGPPPLPTGQYRAVFVQAIMKLPLPAPISVQVVARP